MARISKVEMERRQNMTVRTEKAKAAIMEEFSRLLTKHLPNLIKAGTESAAILGVNIREGKASLNLRYQTTVTDGASCVLDDGQAEMFEDAQQGSKESAPAVPGADAPGEQ